MANEFILHIDLSKLDNKEDNAKDKLDQTVNKETANKNNKVEDDTDKIIKAAKTVGAIALARQTINAGISYGKYRANTIGARYGDTARQNEINNMINITDKLVGIGGSTVTGALIAGPVGAAVGLISGVIPEILSAIERVDQWNIKQRENDINEVRSSERLGLLSTDRNRGK